MDSFRKICLSSRLWIAVLSAAALSISIWSIAPAPANGGGVIGVGIPGLYAQYPYYPYPPGYYPYYPPPAPAYSPAPSYTPQPSYSPQAGPVRRQHRQTIEPPGAEPLAGSANQSTTTSILSISTAVALSNHVRPPAA